MLKSVRFFGELLNEKLIYWRYIMLTHEGIDFDPEQTGAVRALSDLPSSLHGPYIASSLGACIVLLCSHGLVLRSRWSDLGTRQYLRFPRLPILKSEAKFAFKLAAHGIPNVKRIERRLFAKDSTRQKQVPGSKIFTGPCRSYSRRTWRWRTGISKPPVRWRWQNDVAAKRSRSSRCIALFSNNWSNY